MEKKVIGFIKGKSASGEKNTHMLILSMRQWIMWLAVLILLAGLLVWAFWGYIIERSTGTGIILPSSLQIAVAQSRMSGNIDEVYVNIGDKVKKGDILAQIVSVVEDGEIQVIEAYLNALKKQQHQYLEEIREQREILGKHSNKMGETFNIEQSSLNDYNKFLTTFIKNAKVLQKRGAISKVQYRNYLNDYYRLQTDLAVLATKRVNNIFEQSRYNYNWIQDTYRINLLVLEQENKLNLLIKKKSERSKIVAPINGTVTKVFKDVGDVVTRGTTFASLIDESKNSVEECLTLVPIAAGKRIRDNMNAYISPSVAQKEIYGTILGKVKKIYKYPLSLEDVTNIINDKAMAEILCKGGPSIAVEIEMLKDSSTVSGYKWSSNNGPDFKLTKGTLCAVDVDVKKRRPITLVIPYLREFIGYRY